MSLQYILDANGATTAVIVPIEEWNKITKKYSNIEDLLQWQKDIIDQHLQLYKNHSERVMPVEQFFEQMGTDEMKYKTIIQLEAVKDFNEVKLWYKGIRMNGLSQRFANVVKTTIINLKIIPLPIQ